MRKAEKIKRVRPKCRQGALCSREHEACDGCGRMVHGLIVHNAYEDEPFGLCILCDRNPYRYSPDPYDETY